jgi:ERCC4-related helicase
VETTLYNTIMALGLSHVNKVHLNSVSTRALVALDHLGGAAMDRYLLESLLQPTREVITLQQLTCPGELLDERLFRLKRALEEIPRMKAEHGVSRKVKKVVQVLQDHRERKLEKSDYQAIIFVQQRHIASGLTFLLNQDPDLDWISARTLVGHGSHRLTAVDNHDFKRQQAIVADFRAGLFNVLISTSVAKRV